MIVRMLMGVVRPVLVVMCMRCSSRWQFIRGMGMRTFKMVGMIVTTPQLLGTIIGDQQTLAVVPAVAEDIIILLAFGGALILTQAEPFSMRMLFDALRDQGHGQDTIAGGLEEKAVVDIHEAIKTEALVDPAYFRE
jgi:hypothetical protein